MAIKGIVQSLVNSGFRALVVVDRCPLESHHDLVAMVRRAGSRVSLITIDHDVPPSVQGDDELLMVDPASDAVVEGMIKQIAPDTAERGSSPSLEICARVSPDGNLARSGLAQRYAHRSRHG